MILVPGQPTVRVMGDHDLRPELPYVRAELTDRCVEGRAEEPRPARGGLRNAGVGVAERSGSAGAEEAEGLGEFGGAVSACGPVAVTTAVRALAVA